MDHKRKEEEQDSFNLSCMDTFWPAVLCTFSTSHLVKAAYRTDLARYIWKVNMHRAGIALYCKEGNVMCSPYYYRSYNCPDGATVSMSVRLLAPTVHDGGWLWVERYELPKEVLLSTILFIGEGQLEHFKHKLEPSAHPIDGFFYKELCTQIAKFDAKPELITFGFQKKKESWFGSEFHRLIYDRVPFETLVLQRCETVDRIAIGACTKVIKLYDCDVGSLRSLLAELKERPEKRFKVEMTSSTGSVHHRRAYFIGHDLENFFIENHTHVMFRLNFLLRKEQFDELNNIVAKNGGSSDQFPDESYCLFNMFW